MHDNVLQTAVVTAVIFAALFIFQGQKTCGQKMMMNDKTRNEYTQHGHTSESLTKAWTYSTAAFPLGK
jgi:hypothetical protein